jgi:uncharacterized protein (TIGR03435 family)
MMAEDRHMKWGALAALVLLTPHAGGSQTLEVASIKHRQVPPGSFAFASASMKVTGNRVTASGTLTALVVTGYDVRDYQVNVADSAGKVDRDQIYDIEAKAEGDAVLTKDQARLLLQALLTDRFKLKIHRDSKEMPVYNLQVAKSGIKMKETAPGAESKSDFSQKPGPITVLRYTNMRIADFVPLIGRNFDRPLLDKTGLKGGYDFTLEYSPYPPNMSEAETAAFAARGTPPGGTLPIGTALEDQLGLKVRPGLSTPLVWKAGGFFQLPDASRLPVSRSGGPYSDGSQGIGKRCV